MLEDIPSASLIAPGAFPRLLDTQKVNIRLNYLQGITVILDVCLHHGGFGELIVQQPFGDHPVDVAKFSMDDIFRSTW